MALRSLPRAECPLVCLLPTDFQTMGGPRVVIARAGLE